MFLRGSNRAKDGGIKICVTPQRSVQHLASAFAPRRHALTAKLRSRPSQLSHTKTITIKPFEGPEANLRQPQSDYFPQNQKYPLKNSQNIAQFGNLQLQDFLKTAIIGKEQGIQDKSKQIIKILNGTWFKSTHSQELSTHKLYNNLGIKRTKLHYQTYKQQNSQSYNSKDALKKYYTPPNIFPLRKLSPKRNQLSKYLQGTLKNNFCQIFDQVSPLKQSVQRKTSQSKRPPKRSSTSFTTKHLIPNPIGQRDYLLGRKMVLHND